MLTLGSIRRCLSDIGNTMGMAENVWLLALEDTQDRYRRSALGPLWMTLSLGVGAAALGFLYAKVLRQPVQDYIPFITATLFVWLFFVASINESTSAFVAGGPMIKNSDQPLYLHLMRVLVRNIIVLLHTLPVLVIVLVYFQLFMEVRIWEALFGVFLLVFNLNWLCLIFALLGARFRDVSYVVGYVLQFFMFVSPIFWSPAMLESAGWFVDLNPVFHWIVVSREPILGNPIPMGSVVFCLVSGIVGSLAAMLAFAGSRNRIAFWI
jgi:ABC-type polysaccharide/polyol phosphate export permease